VPIQSQVEIPIMNRDQHRTAEGPVYSYDSEPRVTTFSYIVTDRGKTTGPLSSPETPPPYTFDHDREKGVFRLKWFDGEVEVFRDKPTRYLVVEPDRETGQLRPAITHGNPTYLYLCREEREARLRGEER